VFSIKDVSGLLCKGLGELSMPAEQRKQVIICSVFRLHKLLYRGACCAPVREDMISDTSW